METRIPAQDYSYLLLTNCHFVAAVCWVLDLQLELKNVAALALVIKWKEMYGTVGSTVIKTTLKPF